MTFTEPELAIIFTLAYTDQFSYPLTASEIWYRLITLHPHPKTILSKRQFESSLLHLQQQKIIEIEQGCFFLVSRKQLPKLRARRAEVAKQKTSEIHQLQQILRLVPGISAAFVTGSAAMENAEADDDLDVFLVTAVNRLWISRLLLVVMSWLLGKKKKRNEAGKHGWCFNLWLDEHHLQIPVGNRSLYQAYEVIQAKPIWGKPEKIQEFFTQNAWVTTYLPHFSPAIPVTPVVRQNYALQLSWPNWFMTQTNQFAYQWQLFYMNHHRTTEKVAAGFAFFHPRPTAKLIQVGWLQSIRRLKKHPELATIAASYADRFFTKKIEKLENKRQKSDVGHRGF